MAFGKFNNPIVGAANTLIRAAIRSVNYVAGLTGWSINFDGSAEFSNLTSRGSFQAGSSSGAHIIINSAVLQAFDSSNREFFRLDFVNDVLSVLDTSVSPTFKIRFGANASATLLDVVNSTNFGVPINFFDADGVSAAVLENAGRPIYYAKSGLPDLVEATASVGPTSGTTPLTVQSSNSITLDGSTKVKVKFECARIDTSVANDVFTFAITDNGVTKRTWRYFARAVADTGINFSWVSSTAPSAGAHTFAVTVTRSAGTGTLTINGSATNLLQLTTGEFL